MSHLQPFPIVKVTIESLQQQVCYAMTQHLEEIGKQIEASVKVALSEIEIAKVVDEEVRRLVPQIARASVKDFIETGIRNSIYASPLKSDLELEIQKAVSKALEGMKKSWGS